jgi:threonylcarbamoyladenosine tRNA methylthiotransferase MtaB
VPHFHIPLQSGSNDILKLMKRRYLREVYTERVNKIKEVMPHACIGVDVIVGFPGETDEHFLETYHFLNEMDISYLCRLTIQSEIIEAAAMEGVVPANVRAAVVKCYVVLSVKRRAFYENQLGSNRTVCLKAKIS